MSREFSDSDWSKFLEELELPDDSGALQQAEKANDFFNDLESKIENQINHNLELDLKVGFEIDKYCIVSKIGQGGMASVYKAHRADGLYEQEVAIKILSGLLSQDAYMESFAAERRLLAKLNHPNIAKILDAGALDNELPYFVMELVKGKPIDLFCKEEKLRKSDRLGLFIKVAQAIQSAHNSFISVSYTHLTLPTTSRV